MNRPDDIDDLRGTVCFITVRPQIANKRYTRRMNAKVRIEAVAEAGIYIHDGWDPKRQFRNLDFVHWDDIEQIQPILHRPAPWKSETVL